MLLLEFTSQPHQNNSTMVDRTSQESKLNLNEPVVRTHFASTAIFLRGFDQNAAGVLLMSEDPVSLELEPENPYDEHAVVAMDNDRNIIGRVARELAESFGSVLRFAAEHSIRHCAYVFGIGTEIMVRHDGTSYEARRVDIRVDFFSAGKPTGCQIRGLAVSAECRNGVAIRIHHIVDG